MKFPRPHCPSESLSTSNPQSAAPGTEQPPKAAQCLMILKNKCYINTFIFWNTFTVNTLTVLEELRIKPLFHGPAESPLQSPGGEEGRTSVHGKLPVGRWGFPSKSQPCVRQREAGRSGVAPARLRDLVGVPCSLLTIPAKSPDLCQALERERDLGIEAGATLHPNPHRALGAKAELHFPIWVCTEKLQFSKASDCCFSNKSNRWIGNSIYCLFPQHINMWGASINYGLTANKPTHAKAIE